MRWILSLCLIVQLASARDIAEVLQGMRFDKTKQELLKTAMEDFYVQKRVYIKNNDRIRNKILIALQAKEENLTPYMEPLKEVSEQYIAAKLAFYRAVVGILGEEQTQEFIENLNE